MAEGDMSGTFRVLASGEGLALQDGYTIRAIKEKHPSALWRPQPFQPPEGPIVMAAAT